MILRSGGKRRQKNNMVTCTCNKLKRAIKSNDCLRDDVKMNKKKLVRYEDLKNRIKCEICNCQDEMKKFTDSTDEMIMSVMINTLMWTLYPREFVKPSKYIDNKQRR